MLSKTLLTLWCGLSLAAQTPSPLQDSLKAARAASQSGDIDTALNQYKSAFDLAAGSDAAQIPGIAVEIAALLETGKRPADAEAFLLQAADLSESKGLPASAEVPLANRLYRLGMPLSRAGQSSEARQALERSLSILRNAYGPDALCLATALNTLATVNAQSGDTGTAMQERAEAAQIQAKQPPANTTEPVLRAGGDVAPPRIVSKVNPAYADEARKSHYSGTVLLSLVVAPDGVPTDVHILMPLGAGLDEKAIEAVNQWRFQPGIRRSDGHPAPVQATVEVNFRLL
jgi:TonB family protein